MPKPDFAPDARLTVDLGAVAANWRCFARAGGGADCGAAIKADGYGLGAAAVADALVAAGCRDLFVAQWPEVAGLGPAAAQARVAVLHGVAAHDMAAALASPAVPVLVTAAQVQAWRGTGRVCDVMVDTGMNRLGLSPAEAVSELLDGLVIDTLHSHLVCAEDRSSALNGRQRSDFLAVAAHVPARRLALANSAGVGLGAGFALGLTRPGLGLFGGGPGPAGASGRGDPLAAVVGLAARVLQVRQVAVGAGVGYGATFVATRETRLATVGLGYADGYPRALSNSGAAIIGGVRCPVAGRVSMDLTVFDVTDAPPVVEGDWIEVAFDLATTAAAAAVSEYELLTGLGARYARVYR